MLYMAMERIKNMSVVTTIKVLFAMPNSDHTQVKYSMLLNVNLTPPATVIPKTQNI